MHQHQQRHTTILVIVMAMAMAATLALSACDRNDDRTAGQKLDATIAKTEEAGKDAKAASDAGITAGVKAELAKDKALSAMRITVDTDEGHVSLRGTAPTVEARDRASVLAKSVKGVSKVDNKLAAQG